MTADEEASEILLEQLKIIDGIQPEKRKNYGRLRKAWESFKLKSMIGLMASLSIYCVVGGLVSLSLFHA